MHWIDVADIVDVLDDVLGEVAPSAIRKVTVNPLTLTGFDRAVRKMLRNILAKTKKPEEKAIQRGVQLLDRDWASMTARQTERAIGRAARELAKLESLAPAVADTVAKDTRVLITATKRAMKRAHKLQIATTFDVIDGRIVDHVKTANAHYVTDAFGTRAEAWSNQARNIVAKGVEAGYDSTTIAATMAEKMPPSALGRSMSYYRTIAGIYAARGRSYGMARSYSDAGIQRYQIEAVQDEVTTETCLFLHGKIFSTGPTLARYQKVAASPPEAVKELQPWVRLGKDDDGNETLFAEQAGERVKLADVITPGRGQRDTSGTYGDTLSAAKMQEMGISMPPFHGGGCRTTTLPVF